MMGYRQPQLRGIMLVMLLMTSIGMFAFHGNKYWFRVNAKASPTGAGKVYVTDTMPEEELTDEDYKEETSFLWDADNEGKAGTSRFHLFAQPNAGYAFKNWTKGKNVVSLLKHCTPSERSTSKESTNPDQFDYQANFVEKGSVAVYSSNESAGAVVIDNPENKIGDTVTLTAYVNIFAGQFMGWVRNITDFEDIDLSTLDYVSQSTEYTFTITAENQGDYYAVFEPREEGVYCMVSNLKTSHCMGLSGTKELTLATEQRYFKNSVELLPMEKAHSLPAAVVRLKGTSDGVGGLVKAEYISQGHSSKEIASSNVASTTRYFRVEPYTTNTYLTYAEGSGYTGYWRDYDDNNGSYESEEELIGTVYHPWTGNASSIVDDHQWRILPLTEQSMDQYYFGAEPKSAVKMGDKYYTTLYTAFPYKCMDGVKAYTVDKYLKKARIHLSEIESGIVPAYTAVILECNGTTAIENRLIPLLDEPEALTTTNYLKGEIWMNDESGNTDNYRTPFDAKTMRVLSDNKAAFVNTNNRDTAHGDTLMTYIANNTCYLELDPTKAALSQYTFTTEDDSDATLPGDVNNDGIVNITDVMLATNYIIGKEPAVFYFENADVNQDTQITVTDVVLIINIIINK